ncbi:MAG: phosphate ABC transporter permease subunit PstC [Nocardioidaceae bacterium]|nr:phosphate ABC transporter permease subunit PstC [Nocardioidaceae bacterium]MDQ3326159.1 phosphate ABC transporter permease subunit PstC [Actinomycetota bacterium]
MADSSNELTRPVKRLGDRIFSGTALGAGVLILVTLAGVGLFLTIEGLPGFTADSSATQPADNFVGLAGPLVFGTVLSATLALMLAVPLAVGVALFISHYAPRRLSQGLGYLVDLLAAVPSVVYGLWGIIFLAPKLVPIYRWLENNVGWIPFFSGPTLASGRNMATVAVVLAVMILPIITAICREIFLQTPTLHEEAALALGATRWEMIRMAVFPYGRSGIVSAAMLGLGRALGETLAVTLVLSPAILYSFNFIGAQNPSTIASNIALQFPEASGLEVSVLIATGLVLFLITFVVNFAARAVVNRRSEFSGAN